MVQIKCQMLLSDLQQNKIRVTYNKENPIGLMRLGE